MWATDNSFRRHIQIAGKREKLILKKGTHTGLESAKSTTISHAILNSIIICINFIAFGFHSKTNYPKSIGGLDRQDTKSGALF